MDCDCLENYIGLSKNVNQVFDNFLEFIASQTRENPRVPINKLLVGRLIYPDFNFSEMQVQFQSIATHIQFQALIFDYSIILVPVLLKLRRNLF